MGFLYFSKKLSEVVRLASRANGRLPQYCWSRNYSRPSSDTTPGRKPLGGTANNEPRDNPVDNGPPHTMRGGQSGEEEMKTDIGRPPASYHAHDTRSIDIPRLAHQKSRLSEDTIRYLLSRRLVRRADYKSANVVNQLDLASCEAILPSQCRQNPLSVFDTPGVDMEVALAALGLFAKRVHDRYGAAQPARDIYRKERPGQRALYWLLSSDKMGDTVRRTGSRFASLIALGLVAENAHQHLRTWAVAPPSKGRSDEATFALFSGFKVRGGINALMYWTRNEDPLAEALKFFRFCTERSQRGQYVALSIPGKHLWYLLQYSDAARTSVENYDWFFDAVGVWSQDPTELQMQRAILALHRPREPSPFAMLEFLRSCAEDETLRSSRFVAGFLDSPAIKAANFMYWHGVRTAQQLHQRGLEKDARWILNFLAAKMPMRFKRGAKGIRRGQKALPARKLTRWEQERSSLPGGDVRSWCEVPEPFRGLGGV